MVGDLIPAMKILLEIDDEDGAVLDALAAEQDRSRTAQARKMLTEKIRETINPEEVAQ
jgi:hypothetical protein